MNWTYPIRYKWRTAFVFTVVLALMLVKNVVDKRNTEELNSTFNSVYEDRLVVEQYIYQLSKLLYENRLMLDGCADQDAIMSMQERLVANNRHMDEIILAYGHTHLTENEAVVFGYLQKDIAAIERIEFTYLADRDDPVLVQNDAALFNTTFLTAIGHLNELSNIQMETGKALRDNSNKVMAGSMILSRLEIGVLILFGLFVQVLIFSARLSTTKKDVKFGLN